VQLISARQVAARLAVSRTHVYKLVRDEGFPRALRIGGKLAWVEREVDAWIAARLGQR
jgi:prophage regulatory protein